MSSRNLNLHSSPVASRPAYPAEKEAKRRRSFQFPKSILQEVVRPWAALSNRGLLGQAAPKSHVVMCGFPRSGTTLCQLMVQACVPGVQCYSKEEMAMEVARFAIKRQPIIFTKRPRDIFQIEDLRRFYADRPTEVKFILFTRDPRAVLTSFHESRPGEYYVSVERWRGIWDQWQWATQFADVLALRYEQLISEPNTIEQLITRHVGWQVARPFAEFHQTVPKNFDTRALNGLRPLDPTAIDKWRGVKHQPKLRSLLEEMPELPQRLIDLGYERDESWIRALTNKSAA